MQTATRRANAPCLSACEPAARRDMRTDEDQALEEGSSLIDAGKKRGCRVSAMISPEERSSRVSRSGRIQLASGVDRSASSAVGTANGSDRRSPGSAWGLVAPADFKSVGPVLGGPAGGFDSLALPPTRVVAIEGPRMSDSSFIYRGDLSDSTLPEMLATIHKYHVPGVMKLHRDDVLKRIYLLDGDVIFASSSDRSESLGEFLLARDKITKAQLRISTDEMRRSPGMRHGSVLVQLGFLKPEELGPVVREQVQTILWSMFDWDRGTVTFEVGHFREDEVYKIKIPTPRAILSGCKRIRDGKKITTKLGGKNAVFRRLEMPGHLAELRLEANERKLLEMVDGKQTFLELCQNGPLNPGLNARIIYALTLLGLIERAETSSSGIRIQVKTSS